MKITPDHIRDAAKKCLIKAGTTYRRDQFNAYAKALEADPSASSRWVIEQIIENAKIAENEQLPLCDDTGIPHVIVEIGNACALPAGWTDALQEGLVLGLREMPGRPMAVRGDGIQRVEQSGGLFEDPGALVPAPIIVRPLQGSTFRMTVLLLGGGPEIRARTRRIFHRRSIDNVLDQAAAWISEEIGSLGCTPTTIAIGIGRSQMEASSLMLEAMAEGNLDEQSELERKVTDAVNATGVGPLGLGGTTTALGCFLKIGPTRASGVRIVCARPCCMVEPRRASMSLDGAPS